MSVKKKFAAKIILLYILKRKVEKRKSKRLWVREWIRNRNSENIVKKLLLEFRNNDIACFNAFARMTPKNIEANFVYQETMKYFHS